MIFRTRFLNMCKTKDFKPINLNEVCRTSSEKCKLFVLRVQLWNKYYEQVIDPLQKKTIRRVAHRLFQTISELIAVLRGLCLTWTQIYLTSVTSLTLEKDVVSQVLYSSRKCECPLGDRNKNNGALIWLVWLLIHFRTERGRSSIFLCCFSSISYVCFYWLFNK